MAIKRILPAVIMVTILTLTMVCPCLGAEPIADDAFGACGAFLFDGHGESSSSLEETTLGNLAADAARSVCGTDIAIVNGGDIAVSLHGGEIYYSDCKQAFSNDRELAIASVSYSQLRYILEVGVSRVQPNLEEKIDREISEFDGFPQISGFSFKYDLSAPSGERIVWIKIGENEVNLTDDTTTVTLCASGYMLSGGMGFPAVEYSQCEVTLSEALFRYISQYDVVSVPEINRILVRGGNETTLFYRFGMSNFLLILVVICFAAAGSWKIKRLFTFER